MRIFLPVKVLVRDMLDGRMTTSVNRVDAVQKVVILRVPEQLLEVVDRVRVGVLVQPKQVPNEVRVRDDDVAAPIMAVA